MQPPSLSTGFAIFATAAIAFCIYALLRRGNRNALVLEGQKFTADEKILLRKAASAEKRAIRLRGQYAPLFGKCSRAELKPKKEAYEQGWQAVMATLPRVIAIRQRVQGEEHPEVLRIRGILAAELAAQGDDAEAEKEYRAMLAIQQRVHGAEHHVVLFTCYSLAMCLKAQGETHEAAVFLRRAWEGWKKFPDATPSVLESVKTMLNKLEAEEKPATAVRKKTLTAEEKELANEAKEASRRGSNLLEQRKYAEAEKEYRAALKIQEDVLGPEHRDRWGYRNNLAVTLLAQRKYADAEKEYRAVVKNQEEELGPELPITLAARTTLALVLYHQDKFTEAEEENRAVLAIRERVYGAEHRDTLSSRSDLARALDGLSRNAEAERENRIVLAIRERVLGAEHPKTLTTRSNLAESLHGQGRNAEAEKENRTVLAIRERVLFAQHPDIFVSCYNLALCLQAQGRNQDALEFARRAWDGWTKGFGEDGLWTQKARMLVNTLELK